MTTDQRHFRTAAARLRDTDPRSQRVRYLGGRTTAERLMRGQTNAAIKLQQSPIATSTWADRLAFMCLPDWPHLVSNLLGSEPIECRRYIAMRRGHPSLNG
jgi:hypothetical protein